MPRSTLARTAPRSVPRPDRFERLSPQDIELELDGVESGATDRGGFDPSMMDDFDSAPTVAMRGSLDADIYSSHTQRFDACSENAPTSRFPREEPCDEYESDDQTSGEYSARVPSTVIVADQPAYDAYNERAYAETPLSMEYQPAMSHSLAPTAMEALSISDEPDSLQGHMYEPSPNVTTFRMDRGFGFGGRSRAATGAIVAFASVVGLVVAFATIGISAHFQGKSVNTPSAFTIADKPVTRYGRTATASLPDPLGRQFGTVVETPQPAVVEDNADVAQVAPIAPIAPLAPPQAVVAPPQAPAIQAAPPAPKPAPVIAKPAPPPAAKPVVQQTQKPAPQPAPPAPAAKSAPASEANLAQKALDEAKRETDGAL